MKTAHRNASRAKAQRTHYPLIPKFWQPKVPPDRQLVAKVCHWDNITAFVNGTADVEIMWDWIESGLTYSEMARLLIADGKELTDEAVAAIKEQLEIYGSVTKRYQATGRVAFTGTELNVARAAAHVMDQLIENDRHGIAWASREWSNAQMAKLKAAFLKSEALA
ncbi:hypothetical protein D9M73_77760 [compost metagenome]